MRTPTSSEVYASTSFVGFHRWPDADAHTDGRRAYLADVHRHTFTVTAHVAVDHDDRAVEFHDLTDTLEQWVTRQPVAVVASPTGPDQFPGGHDLGGQSCEMLAMSVAEHLHHRWPDAVRSVAVAEDNEVGAVLRWT